MGDAIAHRGPDGCGEWFDQTSGVGLAHRRLAIVDLSVDGAQPMSTPCGRYTVVFNGELYNYRALRAELERSGMEFAWRGKSDTEVLLASIVRWGLKEALGRFNGMFAFALWDASEAKLYLARDRFGEKPLYYGWNRGVFLFGSELKAFRAFPGWRGDVDPDAVRMFLQFCYVPTPNSIYSGIRKLPAGTWLPICPNAASNQLDEPTVYWSAERVVLQARTNILKCDEHEMGFILEDELKKAIALRMVADVPLGVFLSGGIDSSVVASLMQAQVSSAIRTFSIGFNEAAYDESTYAENVAKHLGTEHTNFVVTASEMLAIVPKLASMFDEPFADSSQIPTHLVARLARQHVTVALTGDAGDELFGGYNRHLLAKRLQIVEVFVPRMIRASIGKGLQYVSVGAWDRLNTLISSWRGRAPQRILGYKVHKLGRTLSANSLDAIYQQLVSFWMPVGDRHRAATSGGPGLLTAQSTKGFQFSERMMIADLLGYLPDDILVKVDRATMAVALESRIPFLDPNVFNLAWRIPLQAKIKGSVGKSVLRTILHRYVPQKLIDRPKSGFGVPLGAWLRGPLRDWAESNLNGVVLDRYRFVDTQMVRRVWASHLEGQDGMEYHLWNVIMLHSWLEQERGG